MLERMIVFQEILPGALVSEAALMERTGLGRTPVREALQQLARNRMVEIHPHRGVLIPPTSVEAQLRLLELRRVLDPLAARLGCECATPEDRQQMQDMADRLRAGGFTLESYLDTVRGTHQLIVAGAHNEYLADAMAPVQGLSRRFWLTHVADDDQEIATGGTLHREILEAIVDGDAARAEDASLALNDYLVQFTYDSLRRKNQRRNAGRPLRAVAQTKPHTAAVNRSGDSIIGE